MCSLACRSPHCLPPLFLLSFLNPPFRHSLPPFRRCHCFSSSYHSSRHFVLLTSITEQRSSPFLCPSPDYRHLLAGRQRPTTLSQSHLSITFIPHERIPVASLSFSLLSVFPLPSFLSSFLPPVRHPPSPPPILIRSILHDHDGS